MTNETSNYALIAAEHLVGNLWFNLDALPLIVGKLEPETVRLVIGGPAAMAYSEMARLMRENKSKPSAGMLEASLRQQNFDFDWLRKLQSRVTVEGLDVLYNYTSEINNAAALYRLRMYCADADKQAQQPDAKAETITAGLLSHLAESGNNTPEVEHAAAVGERVRKRLLAIKSGSFRWGASTGFDSLDKLFQMADGDLITIAGRPSQGKTSLWRQMFYNRAVDIKRNNERGQVVMFTSDDTSEKTMLGLACTIAKVDANRIKYNIASPAEWYAVEETIEHIESLPMFFDESSHPTPDGLYYRCAMLNAQCPIKMAGQDYLQLMRVPGVTEDLLTVRRSAEGVKGIGRTLGFPWVELSQIGKDVEKRADKWPTPSDMLYAGEAESDICMMIMRPEHYVSRGEDIDCDEADKQGVALINVGKNKQGDIGMVRMKFEKKYSRFDDPDEMIRVELNHE